MSSYQPGIPTGSVPLNQDYLNIQNNFTQLDTSFGVDHTAFSVNSLVNPAGYHKSIHLISQSPTPTRTIGFGQLFNQTKNDGYSNDEILYFLTGTGNHNIQLTNNFLPTVGSNITYPNVGYTFLPGGFVLQWGSALSTGASTPIVFTAVGSIAFANNLFSITTSRAQITNETYGVTAFSKTGFTFFSSSSTIGVRFFWIAIGN